MHTTSAIITTAIIAAAANAQTPADLTWVDAQIDAISFNTTTNVWEVFVSWEIANIGDAAIDLRGPDLMSTTDDAGLQSFLAVDDQITMMVFAASGFSIDEADIVNPGETFSGTFIANTSQLPDPTVFGNHLWLAIDIQNTTEPSTALGNNRVILEIPTPGTATLIAVAALATTRRRR